jgi:hypothetical protein
MPISIDPFVSVIVGLGCFRYCFTSGGGITASKPDSPSKHVPWTSALVGAATSHRVPGSVQAHQPTCSAAVLVFPAPRPANISHTDHQSPGGST